MYCPTFQVCVMFHPFYLQQEKVGHCSLQVQLSNRSQKKHPAYLMWEILCTVYDGIRINQRRQGLGEVYDCLSSMGHCHNMRGQCCRSTCQGNVRMQITTCITKQQQKVLENTGLSMLHILSRLFNPTAINSWYQIVSSCPT